MLLRTIQRVAGYFLFGICVKIQVGLGGVRPRVLVNKVKSPLYRTGIFVKHFPGNSSLQGQTSDVGICFWW